jgi:predicted nucleotidyltransferase
MHNKAEILKQIKAYAKSIEPQSEVVLFGSRARNDAKEDSDWDILILTPYPVDLKAQRKFRHKLFDIQLEYGIAISTFVYSKEDWHRRLSITPLYKNIKKEGVIL